MKPSIVTSVQGIVKVTTVCWSIAIGEGGLGENPLYSRKFDQRTVEEDLGGQVSLDFELR